MANVVERLIDGVAVSQWGERRAPGVLLWPGLGATGDYFTQAAPLIPGRAVAVDPPGFGRSPPLEPLSYERLVELAASLVADCDCRAIVGHSLGADVALGVAAQPPDGLRAAVLIDGGYLDAAARAQLGVPTGASRPELIAWVSANAPSFPDWDTAVRELAAMFGCEPNPALEAYARRVLVEVDGEVRRDERHPERLADLLLAIVNQDLRARARSVAVPTLLIACAQPPATRPIREPAWREFAQASPLIEVHVAENWGHNPLLHDLDGSTALIAGWLRDHV